jgi:hypothetical protein
VDQRKSSKFEAFFGIGRTLFVMLILSLSAVLLTKDANELVIDPIETMMKKINRIAKNPLEAAQIEEDEALAEEQVRTSQVGNKKRKEVIEMETKILEKTITKIGALLAIGFGEAGSEIIATNMRNTGEVDPMIPGKKVPAIFGFAIHKKKLFFYLRKYIIMYLFLVSVI